MALERVRVGVVGVLLVLYWSFVRSGSFRCRRGSSSAGGEVQAQREQVRESVPRTRREAGARNSERDEGKVLFVIVSVFLYVFELFYME